MNVLFVCTGNTCRSPMAEALLKSKSKRLNKRINVKSRGLYAIDNDLPNKNALLVMKGIADISKHRAKSITADDMSWADYVLVMTKSQKNQLLIQYPMFRNKIKLLSEIAIGKEKDIIDPFGGSITDYKRTMEELEYYIDKFIEKIEGERE
ncbi:MAG: low molecular weight protein arginine phosphatase [Tissierellales bacterium]|nr:low molecular weight protein arginine phosphatase [Tissierellales bacterium]